ncbi:cell division ATP-binding protein FtsE [Vulgatibacter incomptus]|uniref:Cell division ATP-binding protein FtsE n=1 Tax=Vulgatibacter incomptus TaxID=1391653 RepID=A0A0K1PA01_9BACT|nr:cell division ATP-binding protein FtsE [Vulgatibacter incomptus]AKU90345.1 Cell division transporter, ATP-binding protein FtsE [Vulgatibacter incomptus]
MIQLFHVSKTYAGDAPALKGVNLEIEKGELVFLTGPSGAGKSTLLRLLMGAEAPTEGQIVIAGRNVARIRRAAVPYLRRNIGVVFQDFKLIPNRTAVDNVGVSLEVLGTSRREVRRRASEALERVGLGHKLDVLPERLSGGEQQRVAIARAVVSEPSVLLADEPTGNLDPELTLEVMELLTDMSKKGTTVVVATHDHALLERFGDRVVRLAGGVVQEERV